METEELKQLLEQLTENKDSFNIGSASKGGAIKFYCDFNNLEECKKKLDNAKELRDYANLKLEM